MSHSSCHHRGHGITPRWLGGVTPTSGSGTNLTPPAQAPSRSARSGRRTQAQFTPGALAGKAPHSPNPRTPPVSFRFRVSHSPTRMRGPLESWNVPRGLSCDPSAVPKGAERALAVARPWCTLGSVVPRGPQFAGLGFESLPFSTERSRPSTV
ncbi:Hypothetical predicted protein [Marmota monax]|uniref:Uncharacterized protein n=1 Tax=Marmota monax TaxID=9995 RepID=A0A5E4AG68_MARMO|nr:Hypothetical predicted protein [Marmota monax]